jgi:glycosyltransferase involved in cell wall biosynthesis
MLADPMPDDPLAPARATLGELLEGHLAGHSHDPARVELLGRILGSDVCRKLGIYTIPAGFKLSVVIPVYNEVRTLTKVVERVRHTGLPLEIVIVDDGSTDGTRELLARWADERKSDNADLIVVLHERNQGKGGALRTGFARCTGDVIIVQDADLEYDPQDFRALLQPIVEDRADVVYGSRFSHVDGQVHHFWHRWGNQLITRLSNWKSGRALTDVETCYKMIRRELIQQVAPVLRERGFGIELELTFKLARIPGVRFYERPISYHGRTYREGKKIGVKDGLWALWCILWY